MILKRVIQEFYIIIFTKNLQLAGKIWTNNGDMKSSSNGTQIKVITRNTKWIMSPQHIKKSLYLVYSIRLRDLLNRLCKLLPYPLGGVSCFWGNLNGRLIPSVTISKIWTNIRLRSDLLLTCWQHKMLKNSIKRVTAMYA